MEANKELTIDEIVNKHKSVEVRGSGFGGRGRYDLRTYDFEYLDVSSARHAMEEYATSKLHLLQQEYDKLKAHDGVAVSMLEVLRKEYQVLKEKAEKMVADIQLMLNQSEYSPEKSWFEIIHNMKGIGLDALRIWNNSQTNNQNEPPTTK